MKRQRSDRAGRLGRVITTLDAHSSRPRGPGARHATRCSWLLVTVAAGSGCLYRSPINKRTVEVPKSYAQTKGRTAAAGKNGATGRWWTMFGDDQLNRLIALGLKQSTSLAVARARVRQGRAHLMGSRAGWMPSINAGAEVGRSKCVLSDQFQFTATTFSLSLTASYEFDIFGKTRYAHRAASQGALAAEQALRAAHISLAAEIAEAYFVVVASRAQLILLEQTIASRTRLHQLVQRRYSEGVVTALDVYQAQANLARARANLAAFRGTLVLSQNALAVLLGRFPGQLASGALRELPPPLRELPAGVPGQLLLRRPDLRAAHHNLLATDARVGEALAAHFPSLSFSANVAQLFEPTSGLTWGLLGGLLAPLFQGGRIHAEYKRRTAVLQEQLAAFRQTLLLAVKDVEDAVAKGRALEQQVAQLDAQAKAAEGALQLATDQYRQGLQNYLTVLDSEQNVYAAKTDLIGARRELISARIQLARALGGDWPEEKAND